MGLLIGMIIGLPIAFVTHELGHWWLMEEAGFPPRRARLFLGPTLFKFTWRNVPCEIGVLPVGAQVEADPRLVSEAGWLRNLLIYLAGPAVNLAMGLVAALGFYGYQAWQAGHGLGPAVLRAVVAAGRLIDGLVAGFGAMAANFIPTLVMGLGTTGTRPVSAMAGTFQQPFGWGDVVLGFITIQLVLAMFNLIPFPGLDGFGALACLYQGITGRQVDPAVYAWGRDVLVLGLILGATILLMGRSDAIHAAAMRIPEGYRTLTLNLFGLLVLLSLTVLRSVLVRARPRSR